MALLDHLGAEQAVIGGTSLGANVSLEVADIAPERVRGLIVEMPVLDNAVEAGILAFAPLMFAARFLPFTVAGVRLLTRPIPRGIVPFWTGIVLDTLDQRADSMGAVVHGLFFGRVAPSSKRRRAITAPALVVGHPRDPIHPAADAAMLAERAPQRDVHQGQEHPRVAPVARPAQPDRRGLRTALLGRCQERPPSYRRVTRVGAHRRSKMATCLSTETRRSCCAPTSWPRPTGSSRC